MASAATPAAGGARGGSQIACGRHHSLAIRSDGTLWVWGANDCGQLGLGAAHGGAHSSPARVGTAPNWAAVACGTIYSLGLRSDGTLWTLGLNGLGRLGKGYQTVRSSPLRVGSATNWTAVACGPDDHSVALRSDGSLWAWGANTYGQLGLGAADAGPHHAPTQVGTESAWVAVSCGAGTTFALRGDGSLWAWGSNGFYGDLGLGGAYDRHAPARVGTADTWTAIAAGQDFSLATRSDGSLWSWGENDSGELGLGTSDDDAHPAPTRVGSQATWTEVACSSGFSLGRCADGSLWAWGLNGSGQLGLGDTALNPTVPTRVGTAADWTAVACGAAHTVALQSDGSLLTWGWNERGQLGLGLADSDAHPTPARVLTTAA
jgi:alpha-tubulin suppressor-like RCC1 family protein